LQTTLRVLSFTRWPTRSEAQGWDRLHEKPRGGSLMAEKKTVNRSAVTGEFVTKRYTKTHPKTTVTERVAKPTPKKK